MTQPYRRYAVYYTPPAGAFADFGAHWLGWDLATGAPAPQPEIAGIDLPQITETPRKYGFHATLKAPFRLAEGAESEALRSAVRALAGRLAPVQMAGLELSRIGSFLALTPEGDTAQLNALVAEIVRDLDTFRAPLTDAEIARRKPERLSPRQRALLDKWGYPYVFEEFRFHMTLSGALDDPAPVESVLREIAPLPRPFLLDGISLAGEGVDGRFRLIERVAL